MWVLLMISFGLVSIGGPVIVTPLPKSESQMFYETEAECNIVRDRIDADMVASYTGETKDYKLECKIVPKKVV